MPSGVTFTHNKSGTIPIKKLASISIVSQIIDFSLLVFVDNSFITFKIGIPITMHRNNEYKIRKKWSTVHPKSNSILYHFLDYYLLHDILFISWLFDKSLTEKRKEYNVQLKRETNKFFYQKFFAFSRQLLQHRTMLFNAIRIWAQKYLLPTAVEKLPQETWSIPRFATCGHKKYKKQMLNGLPKRMDGRAKQICFSELYLLSSVELFHGFHEQEDCIYAFFFSPHNPERSVFGKKKEKVILY